MEAMSAQTFHTTCTFIGLLP